MSSTGGRRAHMKGFVDASSSITFRSTLASIDRQIFPYDI